MQTDLPILGILGGLGPLSSAYFYELITEHTQADCDQQHIDILISSKATTPDRTSFITGASPKNPLPIMKEEIKRLVTAGASVIAIPCNTAQHFYNSLCKDCAVPILNIISLTVKYAAYLGIKSVGIMATDGTILTESYKKSCEKYNIEYVIPSTASQKLLSAIIYSNIKNGQKINIEAFKNISNELLSNGCESLILGCTELSIIKRTFALGNKYIDSLDVLTACSIAACEKKICNYPSELINFANTLYEPRKEIEK